MRSNDALPSSRLASRFRVDIRFWIALLVIAAGGAGAVGAAVLRNKARTHVKSLWSRSLSGALVLDESGRVSQVGSHATRVLIVSVTCPHCHTLLATIAQEMHGRFVSDIEVVPLEGLTRGRRLLDSLGLSVRLAAPKDLETFRQKVDVSAVPLIVVLDGSGNVTDREVGLPGVAEIRQWLGVRQTPIVKLP